MGTVHAKNAEASFDMTDRPFKTESKKSELDLNNIDVKVDRIVVDGVCKTKNDILEKTLRPVFAAKTFTEMTVMSHQAQLVLEKLELFKQISIVIDTSKGDKASPNGYEVIYNVEERKYPKLNIKTEIGNKATNEPAFILSMKHINMFGRGESLILQGSRHLDENGGYALQFSKPLNGNPNVRLGAGAYKGYVEFPWSSFKEISRGAAIDLVFPTKLGSHCLKWEGVWRDVKALNNATSFQVREQSGHSVKSSLQHILTRDSRDDKIFPSRGSLFKYTLEYAGIGGNVEFIKNDVELQFNVPLYFDSVLQLSMAGGILSTVGQNNDIRINDRFFLGGPLTLRGFTINGVGPHSEGNALGADTYWVSGLHLYTPLPFRPGKGGFGELLKTHFFLTAGDIGNIDTSLTAQDNMRKLLENCRLSYGLGIVLRLGGIARLEFNYTVPYRYQTGDKIDPGYQFGVGMSFL